MDDDQPTARIERPDQDEPLLPESHPPPHGPNLERLRRVHQSAVAGAGVVSERFGGVLAWMERRRIVEVLAVQQPKRGSVGERPVPVEAMRVKHLAWTVLAVRLAAVLVVAWLAVGFAGVATGVLLGLAHGATQLRRRRGSPAFGIGFAVLECSASFLIGWLLGGPAVLVCSIVCVVVFAATVVWGWRVDMQLVATDGQLIHTWGLLGQKDSAAIPVGKIQVSSARGPWFGVGFVTFDTASDQDSTFHNWGLIGHPEQWRQVIMSFADFTHGSQVTDLAALTEEKVWQQRSEGP